MLAEVAHIQMSTYNPGFGKPVPLTSYGIGGSWHQEQAKKRPAYVAAEEFAKKQDEEHRKRMRKKAEKEAGENG